jgi:CubicO group peptidase (beta-lactamase class C family)
MPRSRLLVAFLLSLISSLPAQSPCKSGNLQQAQKTVKHLIPSWKEHLADLHVPGFSVAVVCGDRTAFVEGFGHAGAEVKKPVKADSLFYIASSTKSLTALTAAQLAARGKLDLDAPVKRYLPRFALADPAATENVTIADLLSHRRGITDIKIMVAEAFSGEFDDDFFYRLLREVKPREKFVYSNLNYTILQRAIESATGKTWQAALRDEVLNPLSMKHTTTSFSQMQSDSRFAGMFEEIDGNWVPTRFPKQDKTMNAAGGIASTAPDLARLLTAMLNDGVVKGKRVLPKRVVANVISPRTTVDSSYQLFQRTGYGFGWYDGTYKGHRAVHHFGSYEGAHAHLSFMPEEKIGVVVLVNMHSPVNYFAESIAGSIYDALLGLPEGETWSATEAAAKKSRSAPYVEPHASHDASLAGTYTNSDWGTIVVSSTPNGLAAKLGIAPLLLDFKDPASPRAFTTAILGNPVKGRFEEDGGKIVIRLEVPHETATFTRR